MYNGGGFLNLNAKYEPMKNILVVLFFVPGLFYAQANIGNGDGQTTDTQIGIVMHEIPIEGSPYMNPAYKKGETIMNGKTKRSALMRYNAFSDAIELLDENNTPRKLLRRKSIQATIDGKTYKIYDHQRNGKIREGYFNPLSEGEISFLFKPKKIFVQAQKPDHGYDDFDPPIYKDVSAYYVKNKSSAAVKIRLTKKQVLKHLANHKDEIRNFITKHKLRFNIEDDVVKLFDYYNEISAAKNASQS